MLLPPGNPSVRSRFWLRVTPGRRHRLTLLDRSVSRESEGREQPGGGGVATRSRKLPPEALALYPKDVDPGRGAVRVLHGKGDKVRTEGLDPGLRRSTCPMRWAASGRPALLILPQHRGHGRTASWQGCDA